MSLSPLWTKKQTLGLLIANLTLFPIYNTDWWLWKHLTVLNSVYFKTVPPPAFSQNINLWIPFAVYNPEDSEDRVMYVLHSGNRCSVLLTSGTFLLPVSVWTDLDKNWGHCSVSEICQWCMSDCGNEADQGFIFHFQWAFSSLYCFFLFIVLPRKVTVQTSKLQQVFRLGHQRC